MFLRSFPSFTGRVMVGVWWALISLPAVQVVLIITPQELGFTPGYLLVLVGLVGGAVVARLPWVTDEAKQL
jgi:hypothetical protein